MALHVGRLSSVVELAFSSEEDTEDQLSANSDDDVYRPAEAAELGDHHGHPGQHMDYMSNPMRRAEGLSFTGGETEGAVTTTSSCGIDQSDVLDAGDASSAGAESPGGGGPDPGKVGTSAAGTISGLPPVLHVSRQRRIPFEIGGTPRTNIAIGVQTESRHTRPGRSPIRDRTESLASASKQGGRSLPRGSYCGTWWKIHGVVAGSLVLAVSLFQLIYLVLLFTLHATPLVNLIVDAPGGALEAWIGVGTFSKTLVGTFCIGVLGYCLYLAVNDCVQFRRRGGIRGVRQFRRKRWTFLQLYSWLAQLASPGSGYYAYTTFADELVEFLLQTINLHEYANTGVPKALLVIYSGIMFLNAVASWVLTMPRTFGRLYKLMLFEALTDTFFGTFPLVLFVSNYMYIEGSGVSVLQAAPGESASVDAYFLLLVEANAHFLTGDFVDVATFALTKFYPLFRGVRKMRHLASIEVRYLMRLVPGGAPALPRHCYEETRSTASSDVSSSSPTERRRSAVTVTADVGAKSRHSRSSSVIAKQPSRVPYRPLPRWAAGSFIMAAAVVTGFAWVRFTLSGCPQDQPKHWSTQSCIRATHPAFVPVGAPRCTCSIIAVDSAHTPCAASVDSIIPQLHREVFTVPDVAKYVQMLFILYKGQRGASSNAFGSRFQHSPVPPPLKGCSLSHEQFRDAFRLPDAKIIVISANVSTPPAGVPFSLPSEIGLLGKAIRLEVSGDYPALAHLPTEVGLLDRLRELWITRSAESWERDKPWANLQLPPSLGRLSNLVEMQVTEQGISLVPSEIGFMTSLRQLSLRANKISVVPVGIARLSQLVDLDVSDNAICASLDLSRLSQLTALSLRHNLLTELPPNMFTSTTKLREIHLDANDLRALPPELFLRLPKLRKLELQHNRLETITSDQFDGNPALKSLNLGSNHFSHLPPTCFISVSVLEFLSLAGNRLTYLPSGLFASLSHLTSLAMDRNRLTGLPSYRLTRLSRLKALHISHNLLTDLHSGLFKPLSRLSALALQGNRLTRVSAELFTPLSRLRRLEMDRNRLTFLPAELFSSLVHLKDLKLDLNELHALAADQFRHNVALLQLSLQHNRLTAVTGSQFAGLSRLEQLYIDNNRLTFLWPGVFDGLAALKVLSLADNQLTALSANQFHDNAALEYLFLANNRLALSSLDASLGARLDAVVAVDIAGNELEEIPGGVHRLTQLRYLDVSNNRIQNLGALPCMSSDNSNTSTATHSSHGGMAGQLLVLGRNPVCLNSSATLGRRFVDGTGVECAWHAVCRSQCANACYVSITWEPAALVDWRAWQDKPCEVGCNTTACSHYCTALK